MRLYGFNKREEVGRADFGVVLHELLEGVIAGSDDDGGQAIGVRGGNVCGRVSDDADGGLRSGL